MHDLIRTRPLATLVTLSPHGLEANHIPMMLLESPAPFGTLRGHVVRSNPVWREAAGNGEALAVFCGPSAYVRPSWYATKRETGKVVPTWNYAVVHAHGPLRAVNDRDWLRSLLEGMVARNEGRFAGPWSISDAPADYIERAMEAIVGVEIVISRLSGKWKVSQNQPLRNRLGVVEGLKASGTSEADAVADLVRARSDAQNTPSRRKTPLRKEKRKKL